MDWREWFQRDEWLRSEDLDELAVWRAGFDQYREEVLQEIDAHRPDRDEWLEWVKKVAG